MSVQSGLNIQAEIVPAKLDDLEQLLARIKPDPGDNAVIPFSAFDNIHFARLVILPGAIDSIGAASPPVLVMTTNFDGDADSHLDALVQTAGAGLRILFSHCVDFPSGTDEGVLRNYLDSHNVKIGALYINTIGREATQVTFEARLHLALQSFLDSRDWTGQSPQQVREALIEHVRGNDDLRPALTRPMRQGRLLDLLILGVVALIALVLALAFLPLVILFVIVLRIHEIANRPDNHRPRNEHIRGLEQEEDLTVQNQVSALGWVQRGLFRRWLLRLGLWVLQFGARRLYNRGKLVTVDTIHFARWVMFDGGRRLYFFSNFDGSPESYQDDFVDRVAFGLNLVFSNGAGWPRTRFLVGKGAKDEQAFKAYYRDHQTPTAVWYQAEAYKNLTAVNIINNAKIREGLSGEMSEDEIKTWLARF